MSTKRMQPSRKTYRAPALLFLRKNLTPGAPPIPAVRCGPRQAGAAPPCVNTSKKDERRGGNFGWIAEPSGLIHQSSLDSAITARRIHNACEQTAVPVAGL